MLSPPPLTDTYANYNIDYYTFKLSIQKYVSFNNEIIKPSNVDKNYDWTSGESLKYADKD